MSLHSKTKTALRRLQLQEEAMALRAENPKARYVPVSQRDTDPYPTAAKPKPKYTKDRWGITLQFRTNRKERRANGR